MERGPWYNRSRWYSICSAHQNHDPECKLCQIGDWRNENKLKISSLVYKISPKIWIWWVNRKPLSFKNIHDNK